MARPIIGVMGGASAGPAQLEAGFRLGALLAKAGYVVLTGGRRVGVMDAALRGAKSVEDSLTIGILPGNRDEDVSRYADLVIFTGLGDARNAINVLTPAAIVACGADTPGTASEVALALKARRPVILLAPSAAAAAYYQEIAGSGELRIAETPEAAMKIIETLEIRNAV